MPMSNLKETMKTRVPDNLSKVFSEMFEILPKNEEENEYLLIPCYKLIIDENQPFRLYTEEQLKDLAERIKRSGLINPITVRPIIGDKFEILSGRNRAKAVMLNGDKEIKAIIRDVDDDVAALIMIDANLGQRENLLPSEKAFAYKMEVDILNRRGKRPDSSLGNNCPNFDARELIGEKHNESKRTISGYIRLTYLIPELLTLVDDKDLPLTTGVELSYLSKSDQKILLDEYIGNGVKLSKDQISMLKALAKESELNRQTMAEVFKEKEDVNKKPQTIKLKRKDFSEFDDIIDSEPKLIELFREFLQSYKNKQT